MSNANTWANVIAFAEAWEINLGYEAGNQITADLESNNGSAVSQVYWKRYEQQRF